MKNKKVIKSGENPERHLPGRLALFVIAMILFSYIVRKCPFTKLQGKINHLMYTDIIKLFAKKEKEAIGIYNSDRGIELS